MRILLLTSGEWVGPAPNQPGDVAGGLWGQSIYADVWPPTESLWRRISKLTGLPLALDPLRSAKVLIRQRRYDAIVGIFEESAVIPAMFKRIGLLRRPLALWDFSPGTEWRTRKLFQKIVLPSADKILCLSSSQMRAAENSSGGGGKATWIGYNIDTAFFDPAFASEGSYVLSVGKDISRDYATLLQATASCAISLTICTRLKLDLAASGLANISVVDRWLTLEELRNVYGGAKFVVLPLKDVPHPGGITNLAEAMSMGKAVICSDSAGIRDYLRHGENVIVVPPENPLALRDAICLLESDAGLRRKLGQNARKYAEEVFSDKAFGARIHDALAKLN
jgi:glycosyltransferase involved in cell wall biosynthesis